MRAQRFPLTTKTYSIKTYLSQQASKIVDEDSEIFFFIFFFKLDAFVDPKKKKLRHIWRKFSGI